MSTGENLLTLQEIDLEADRLHAELKDLLELKELSRKRAAYKKLKAEEARLIAARKDLEFELEDLERTQRETEQKVTIAQHDAHVLKDYREVQDLEVELSLLAKQLDKLAFDQDAKRAEIDQARDREAYIIDYVAKFEASLLHDAQEVREAAQKLKGELAELEARRKKCVHKLDEDVLRALRRRPRRAGRGGGREARGRRALCLPHGAHRVLARRSRPLGRDSGVPVLPPHPHTAGRRSRCPMRRAQEPSFWA